MKEILICALASAGILFFCWCVLGWLLLPAFGDHAAFVLKYEGDAETMEQDFRTYQWMQGSGILRGKLCVIDLGMKPDAKRRCEKLLLQTKHAEMISDFSESDWSTYESAARRND